jgi:hypothetical protein
MDRMPCNRREFLWNTGAGLGSIALATLFAQEKLLAAPANNSPRNDLNGGLHHRARAKRIVQIFLVGGISQIDSFDYKPRIIQQHGQPFDPGGKVELFGSTPGTVMRSPWEWQQHGECGRWVSGLFPHLAGSVDDLTVVLSMVSKTNVHAPASFMQNTGFLLPGFPTFGAWASYGLGSLNANLPCYVVLPDPMGLPPGGASNWGAGFLPAEHQGTLLRADARNPIPDLFPPATEFLNSACERDSLAYLDQLNRAHAAERVGDSRLAARIAAYELAARLQVSAPEVFDLSGESEATRRAYGLDQPAMAGFARNCLLTRRLLERGVRFVQLWSGAKNAQQRSNWDSHADLPQDHGKMALAMDRPTAALLKDLKQRGLLDDTILLWTTEFGRMACTEGRAGRDHNPFAFASWMAGGGFKPGIAYGESDEWSWKVVQNPVYCYDLHATLLHLLGIDHTRLTFKHNGANRRLTDVHGHVLQELLA